MSKYRQLPVCLALALLLGPSIDGQERWNLTNDSRRKIDEIIAAERQRLKIPGIGVAIVEPRSGSRPPAAPFS
jgi:hypothetical protein